MNRTFSRLLIVNLLAVFVSAAGAEHPELKAFPEAKEGMDRYVIVLPHKDRGEEGDFKVEMIVGDVSSIDSFELSSVD